MKSCTLNIEGQPKAAAIVRYISDQLKMIPPLTKEANETRSDIGRPSITVDKVHAMTVVWVKRMLEISLLVIMGEIREAAGSCSVHELINFLHRKEFYLFLFKAMMRFSRECQIITGNVLNKTGMDT